jgi:hypothetical protein
VGFVVLSGVKRGGGGGNVENCPNIFQQETGRLTKYLQRDREKKNENMAITESPFQLQLSQGRYKRIIVCIKGILSRD